MVNRDKTGSFTIEQLKRQYNLDNKKATRAIEQQSQNLIKLENELDSIMTSIIINLGELLENQSNISLWFFDGTPSLENDPYISWSEPTEHEGDLYYDRQTGIVYKFINNTWVEQTEKELNQAMALTNTATDTNDNERKVFFTTPTVPYKSGDWWIKEDGVLYICQIGKEEGAYEDEDFIISSGYQDAISVKNINDFTVLNGKVTTIEQGVDEITQTMEESVFLIDEEGNKQPINQKVSELSQTTDEFSLSIQSLELETEELTNNTYSKEEINKKLTDGSVTKVVSSNYIFDENGMSTQKTDANTNVFLGFREQEGKKQEGLSILDKNNDDNELLFAGYDENIRESVVRTENLTVKKYFQMGSKSRFEDYTDASGNEGTGCFIL